MGGQSRPNPQTSQTVASSSRVNETVASGSSRHQGTSHVNSSRREESSSSNRAGASSQEHGSRDGERKRKQKMRLIEWKYTTAPMNARDLARDDDFVRYIRLLPPSSTLN